MIKRFSASLLLIICCSSAFAQDQKIDGNLQIGLDGGSEVGLGKRLYFSGLEPGTDYMWMSRFNRAFNSTDLRLNIGDDYGSGGDRFVIGTSYYMDGQFYTHMVVADDGKVGIGTETFGDERLAVNGKIRAREIKIEGGANWPDYVFKPNYKLTQLNETKRFIDKFGHLPDMPSAEQAAKDGVNLGEMNKLLLKKVEELTLHLIKKDSVSVQQDRKLEIQEDRIVKLERAINLLQKIKR